MENRDLIINAIEARKHSYSPYSKFKVGAAVITKDGKIYTGCNIENSAYSSTICAERVALSKAISEGNRDIVKIAVVGNSNYTSPCGECRQFIIEFGKDIQVLVANSEIDYKIYSIEDLLPVNFGEENLKKES